MTSRVAVAGHRDALESPDLRAAVRDALAAIAAGANGPPESLSVTTLLARGADMLVAEEALRLGARLVAMLPMPHAQYRAGFSFEDAVRFDALLDSSACVLLPLDDLPQPLCYRETGRRMLDASDVLLAVWDGLPSSKVGGTGDVVAMAVSMGKPVVRVAASRKGGV